MCVFYEYIHLYSCALEKAKSSLVPRPHPLVRKMVL